MEINELSKQKLFDEETQKPRKVEKAEEHAYTLQATCKRAKASFQQEDRPEDTVPTKH